MQFGKTVQSSSVAVDKCMALVVVIVFGLNFHCFSYIHIPLAVRDEAIDDDD